MKEYKELTRLYPVSKTLRFELKPIGKTLENIEKKGLISQDEQRAEEYVRMKEIIDRFHKLFIKTCLEKLVLKVSSDGSYDSLEEYEKLASCTKKTEQEELAFTTVKTNLRRQIVKAFKSSASYDSLFKKELITKILPDYVIDKDERLMVEHFQKFTSYFHGFHENRMNMYSDEKKSTSIAYRIINENLPMFIDNMKSLSIIEKSEVHTSFAEIESNFSELLNNINLSEMFMLNHFSEVLTQERIDLYNAIIGGRTTEKGENIKGINGYVNQYNQQHKEQGQRLPLLKPLYKMILSDKVSVSWLPEEFKSDAEMLSAVNEAHNLLENTVSPDSENGLMALLQNIGTYDTEHIYISNGPSLSDISQGMFGQYDLFSCAIKKDLRNSLTPTPKEKRDPDLFDKHINKLFKNSKSFSIEYLNSISGSTHTIQKYFQECGAFDRDGVQSINLFSKINIAFCAASDVLAGKVKNICQSDSATALIKNLLDSYKELQHFIVPLLGSGEEPDKDNVFNAKLKEAWDILDIITPLYNKVRNWLTRKPFTTEKIKLNFENAQLLGGWDVNKEPDCTAVLLKKDDGFFLGIMDKKANHAFDVDKLPDDGDCYEKIDYKLLPGANKMLPKVFFSKSRIDEFAPSEGLLNAYKKGTHKKGSDFKLDDCHRLIDFFKQSIAKHEDWKKFPFNFSATQDYEDISGFYKEVEQQGYTLDSRKVSERYITNLVNEGKLYLFRIWNKDFSEFSKGTPNMHTLYWKMLFDKRNLADVVYKLNGRAEVFYRKHSLDMEQTTVHKANVPIQNKIGNNEKKECVFPYDIIKDRRYSVDKFQFHVPITMNFKASGIGDINSKVTELIRNNGIEHIIGIDRGERHLLYLSLIDLKGNIIKQTTLNNIVNEYNGYSYSTNYKDILTVREGNRKEARKSWKKIDNIKDLKKGYLGQIVHIISKMMIEYKAIVVLEDLNTGFIRGRQKIERSVYEQFEKMLIDKLNYCVDKQQDTYESGGLLNAYQLAGRFDSFRKLGKQSGCLFYIPAWNTSKIDPATGFVNLIDTRYESAGKALEFFSSFDSIRYVADKDWFEFAFDYRNFTNKAEGTRTKWTLCTYGTRIETFRNPDKCNNWDNIEINLTEKFKDIFKSKGININGNLKEAICSCSEKSFLEELMHAMRLLLQMRNSIADTDIDYLISPVHNEEGIFYDSRKCGGDLPQDADANGAFNIARKGLWVLRKIKASKPDERVNLAISNKEWLQFAQSKPYLDD